MTRQDSTRQDNNTRRDETTQHSKTRKQDTTTITQGKKTQNSTRQDKAKTRIMTKGKTNNKHTHTHTHKWRPVPSSLEVPAAVSFEKKRVGPRQRQHQHTGKIVQRPWATQHSTRHRKIIIQETVRQDVYLTKIRNVHNTRDRKTIRDAMCIQKSWSDVLGRSAHKEKTKQVKDRDKERDKNKGLRDNGTSDQ